jgi:dTDP-4-amino-4,6-dideoxygalactose transaminase
MTRNQVERVPFLDLAAMNGELWAELDAAWADVTAMGAFVDGPHLQQFEEQFASYCGASHCVGVGNGTDALAVALVALGIGRGDEVIVPANTFVATVEAVTMVGATPVFVDVDPDTLLVTAAHIEAAVAPPTAAVIVVHLYGQMPDMEAICCVTERAGLALLEDAAQAHGAAWAKRRAGTYGRAAAFSFYPSKNLGAFGDAGAVVTNDADLARRARCIADHGRADASHYDHVVCGRNSRLDALQAAVLSVKLPRLDDWNGRRREAAQRYRRLLEGTTCRPLFVDPRATAVHHLEVVRVPARDDVLIDLAAGGIGWGLHYPVACHQQAAFADFSPGPLPVIEEAATTIVSLPMFPTITDEQVDQVCEAILAATEANGNACTD